MRESVIFRSPVVVTLPYMVYGEAVVLRSLVNSGADVIHIRKPQATEYEIETLLAELQSLCGDMANFTLHYNVPMAREFGLGGVHLRPEEIRDIHAKNDTELLEKRLSCSVHSWEEARDVADIVDYMFFSPLFDSVSKTGYKGSIIDPVQIRSELERIPHTSVIGLSGIDTKNIWEAGRLGFDGVAALGSVWKLKPNDIPASFMNEAVDFSPTLENYSALANRWRGVKTGILQLISDGNIATAIDFLNGGGRWIQLRMKDAPKNEIIEHGQEIFTLCREVGATFIVDDDPHIAKELFAHGVHLGKNDMSPAEARNILGPEAIIGTTANTLNDIILLSEQPIDYIGLGPYRFTTTKKNLSPVLGIEGCQSILRRMQETGIKIPVVTIGGIEPTDCREIINAGAWGIAASGAITTADDKLQKTTEFLQNIISS